MSVSRQYSDNNGQKPISREDQQSANTAKIILLSEYDSQLRTADPVRFVNRSLLIAVIVLQVLYATLAIRSQVALLIVTSFTSCFWFLQELSSARRLTKLGEIIASTGGELASEMEADYLRAVILPLLPREAATSTSGTFTQVPPSSKDASEPSPRVTPDQIWTNAYVNWLHESQKDKWLKTCQRAEPIIWLGLAFVFQTYHLLFAQLL
jgi:hypothetical protein